MGGGLTKGRVARHGCTTQGMPDLPRVSTKHTDAIPNPARPPEPWLTARDIW